MRQNQETTPEATEQENLDALDEGFELGMDEEKQQDGKQNEPERQEERGLARTFGQEKGRPSGSGRNRKGGLGSKKHSRPSALWEATCAVAEWH